MYVVYVSVKWKVNFLATHVPENNVPLALLWVKMTI